jgi:hypothetical protein
MFLDPRGQKSPKKIAAHVAAYLKQTNLSAELLLTTIAEKGAAVTRSPRS